MKNYIIQSLTEAKDILNNFLNNPEKIQSIEKAAKLLISCLKTGNTIYSCGNGGSMSDAMHFAEELTGRFRQNRVPLSASAISDPGHITCVANDFGYECIFSRYLEAKAHRGDCFLAISTSGKSNNVIKAAEYARANDIVVISLTGASDSPLGAIATVDICAGKSKFADRIQELHIKIIHILIEQIERDICPENY